MGKLRRNSVLSVVRVLFFIAIPIALIVPGAPAAQAAPIHFAAAVSYNTEASLSSSVAVADVNGDGIPDLIVGSECQPGPIFCSGEAGGVVSVLLGNGDGTFQPAMTYDLTGYGPLWSGSVEVADVNGDGRPDVVAIVNGETDSAANVLLGNGNGTFQPPVAYQSGGYNATSVAVVDVNGDGKPDVVVVNQCLTYNTCGNGGVVSVLLGSGDGIFQSPVNYSLGGTYPQSLVVADLNGDGKPDLIVAKSGSSSVSVLLGKSDGTFQDAASYNSGGESPQSLAAADVNEDGELDLVVANGGGGGICPSGMVDVLLGNGDGTFQSPSGFTCLKMFPFSVAAGDVNGDGKQDVIVANSCGNGCNHSGMVSVLAGDGDGTFQAPVSYYPGGWYPTSVAIADVNADGKRDLFVTSYCGFDNCGESSVGVLLNNFMANTKIAIISSLNPSFVEQQVTFTAAISSNPPIPDGETITFYNETTILSSVPLADGIASYSVFSLPAGSHAIHAKYSGDTWHKPSSGTVQQVVQKYATTTNVISSPNPSSYGQTVTFTATVTPSGPYDVSGKVKFFDGTTGIGTAILNRGVATLKKSTLAVGTHPITAKYLSDAYNDKSTSAVVNQVVQ